MKERPILFSGPMVRAILDGRKMQTRRIVKPQPSKMVIQGVGHLTIGMNPADDGRIWYDTDCVEAGRPFRCPYGEEGDRLWVKENFHVGSYVREAHTQGAVMAYAESKQTVYSPMSDSEMARCRIKPDPRPWAEARTVPSIHMPRWASRITLEIESVRLERLQDISKEDAISEGCDPADGALGSDDIILSSPFYNGPFGDRRKWPVRRFMLLWIGINGQASWNANPWVWVVQFRNISSKTNQ